MTIRVAYTLEQFWHRVPGGTATSALGVAQAMVTGGHDVELVGVSARHAEPPPRELTPPMEVRALALPRRLLYETWHDRELVRSSFYGAARPARWREFLDEDLGKWESIAVDAAQRAGAPRMAIVPGGQAMARLTDAIRAGSVPGLTSEAELFSDTIHLRPLGNYFVALVQFAAIHRKSPVGATNAPTDAAGQRREFAAATATALQNIAWDAVANYAWSGLRSDG